jgi:hypothetical protein
VALSSALCGIKKGWGDDLQAVRWGKKLQRTPALVVTGDGKGLTKNLALLTATRTRHFDDNSMPEALHMELPP